MSVSKMDGRRVLAVLSLFEDRDGGFVAEVIGIADSTPDLLNAARWTGSDPTECVRQAAEHLRLTVTPGAGQ